VLGKESLPELEEWSEIMIPCEYFLVQYVPFPREELRLPIGLILIEGNGKLVRHGVTRDWRTVQCLDPRADLAVLRSLTAFLESMIQESGSERLRPELYRVAEANLGVIQIARPRGVETEDPELEFDRLFEEHVGTWRVPMHRSAPRAGTRRWIRDRLRQALEPSPVWTRLRSNVPVEEFTAPGDRFQMDFSYQPNGSTNYLHAISLEHDWNQAKVLSYTYSRIRARIPAALTAIVASEDPQLPAALSCRQILQDTGISLRPVTELDGLVREIRQELESVP
jgi:hypothetical protein